ncbi:MAG: SBBP repeat-containing protein [candidate division WOR-3 bacterium]|nr:SBBP repeat-containing protein [candidate division WOR-3 bacterium]
MRKVFLVYIVTACMMVTVVLAGPPREVWNRVYDSGYRDEAHSVAVDASGNSYVTGVTSYIAGHTRTIKYDTDGNVQWNRWYCPDADSAHGIVVDASGNVYITGCAGFGYGHDYFTVKYDNDGIEQWDKVYDSGYDDHAYGIAVDASGSIYITGGSGGGYDSHDDYCTIKYDANGNLQWEKVYDFYHDGSAYGIAVDQLSNVYVTGSFDYLTIKYDADGNLKWTRSYDSGYNDRAYGVAVDVSGNVYVTGSSGLGVDSDYLTIKYDTDGNLKWIRTYDSGCEDCAYGIAVDALGDIYVTGFSWQKHGSVNSYYDYCTIKYDADGNLQWVKTYDSGWKDIAYGIAVDASYNIYITGHSSDNYRTIKYEQDDIPAVVEQPKAGSPLRLEVLRNITSNPVLQYTLPPSANGNLVLYSSNGQAVEKFTLTESESSVIFDCSLPSGVYFAKLTTELSSTIAKVVLVK